VKRLVRWITWTLLRRALADLIDVQVKVFQEEATYQRAAERLARKDGAQALSVHHEAQASAYRHVAERLANSSRSLRSEP
jgi:hypothetical protein